MAKKHKSVQIRDKVLLETSVQINKLLPTDEDVIRRLTSTHEAYSLYFVLYEFKSGFIRSLIEFYFTVKVYNDVSLGVSKWSKKFQTREIKNKIILEALMARIYKTIQTADVNQYLRQVEGVIFHSLSNFENGLRTMIGDFASDQIVKKEIYCHEDYQEFLNMYDCRKTIPLQSFWLRHTCELKTLLSNKSKLKVNDTLTKTYNKLTQIEKDTKNCDKFHINKALGDVVIAIDCPKTMKLASYDNSFDTLSPLLGKENVHIEQT